MKKIVTAVLFVVFTLSTARSYAVGQPGFGMRSGQVAGMRMGMANNINNTQRIAYRSIIRAANSLQMAEAVFKKVENGKILFDNAKKYYNTANKLYDKQNYTQATHYAISSMCLSSALLHIYRAKNPIVLPKKPK